MRELQTASFETKLTKTQKRLKRVLWEMEQTEKAFVRGDAERTYACAFELAAEAEKLALLTRELPAFTGHHMAPFDLNDMLLDCCDVNVGYTPQGWFSLQMPMLLPNKEQGDVDYVRTMLHPFLRRFFAVNPPFYLASCVVAFRHVYADTRPEREYRDHDNIELNMVVDMLALYTMKDDGALLCRHYYCSAAGDSDRTEVYVVPNRAFPAWLEFESKLGKTAITLLEAPR